MVTVSAAATTGLDITTTIAGYVSIGLNLCNINKIIGAAAKRFFDIVLQQPFRGI